MRITVKFQTFSSTFNSAYHMDLWLSDCPPLLIHFLFDIWEVCMRINDPQRTNYHVYHYEVLHQIYQELSKGNSFCNHPKQNHCKLRPPICPPAQFKKKKVCSCLCVVRIIFVFFALF